jgi:hypothetical protein
LERERGSEQDNENDIIFVLRENERVYSLKRSKKEKKHPYLIFSSSVYIEMRTSLLLLVISIVVMVSAGVPTFTSKRDQVQRQRPMPLPLDRVPPSHNKRPAKLGGHNEKAYQKQGLHLSLLPKSNVECQIFTHVYLTKHTATAPGDPQCEWDHYGAWRNTTHLKWFYNYRGSGLSSNEVNQALYNAFQTWRQYAPMLESEFIETRDYASLFAPPHYLHNNRSEIVFGEMEHAIYEGKKRNRQIPILAVTHVCRDRHTHDILETDILFNSKIAWVYTNTDGTALSNHPQSFSLYNVAVNQIGHALGMSNVRHHEHSMYSGTRPGELNKITLECGDRDGIVRLYP